jgi:ABC-2 type transport system permease protein
LLPTRSLADVLAATASGNPFAPGPLARLAGFAALFGVLALWGFRRDEGRHYR